MVGEGVCALLSISRAASCIDISPQSILVTTVSCVLYHSMTVFFELLHCRGVDQTSNFIEKIERKLTYSSPTTESAGSKRGKDATQPIDIIAIQTSYLITFPVLLRSIQPQPQGMLRLDLHINNTVRFVPRHSQWYDTEIIMDAQDLARMRQDRRKHSVAILQPVRPTSLPI